MPVVSNTEKDPAGAPHRNALVHVRLVAALVGAYPGYVSASDFSIIGEWSTRTNSDGDWSVDLVANELISPADTYYQADVQPKVGYPVRHEFAVPNGTGPYRVEDILINPPANLPVLHLLDPTDAHDASAISVVPGGNLAATNAQAALLELDAQDAAEATARAAADASIVIDAGANLAAETAARIAADTAEASTRLAADSTLTTNLAAEVTNRTADVNAEETRALAAESVLTAGLANEATARIAGDAAATSAANAAVAAEATARTAADTSEATARAAADSALGSNLTTEITNRIADVNAEETRALAAESTLTTNLAAEVTNRAAAVSSEATARTAADSAEASARATADTTLTTNLAAEIANRTAALNAELIRALAAESVLAGDIAGLDVDLGTIDTNLATEVTNRTSADATLAASVASEVTNRTNADNALSAAVALETANRVTDVNTEETRALAVEALKADDNAVVKLTGAQTVAGKKTHSTAPEVNQTGRVRVVRETRTPRQFGAPMNGVDDDTAGFRAALDAMGTTNQLRPAELVIDGPLLLSDTVIIDKKSGAITSPGWGSSLGQPTDEKCFIKWTGAAGVEMIRIYQSWGLKLEGLRLVGNSAAKPTAAIRCFMGAGNSNQMLTMRRLWFGPLWGYDTDQARQFATAVVWDGTNLNNDLMRLDTLCAHMCDTGYKWVGSQMGEHTISHLLATYCGVGIDTATNLGIEGYHCLANDVSDIKISADSRVEIAHFSSEASAQMADLSNCPAKLTVRGGAWGAEKAKIRSDGRWINGQTPYVTEVTLEDFTLAQETAYATVPAGPVPVIRLRGGSQKMLTLDRCPGIQAVNIDAQADAGGERRIIQVSRSPRDANAGIFRNDFDQGDYDETRMDIVEQSIAQRRATAPAVVESWRSSNAITTNDEIGRWDFLTAAARNVAAQMRAVVGPDFADTGELEFRTKYSGSPIASRLRILRNGVLKIFNTTANPSDTPTGGGYLYVDKDDGGLKFKGSAGTVTTMAPP